MLAAASSSQGPSFALSTAVVANNEQTVREQLASGASQSIIGTHLDCRDMIYRQLLMAQQYHSPLIPCKQRIFDMLCQAKVDKDIRKLTRHGPINEQKARKIFDNLIRREALCKVMIESRNCQFITSPTKPKNTFYLVNDPSTLIDSTIVKDKGDSPDIVCETEAFVYRLAWLMGVEDSFIPTTKTKIHNPNIGSQPARYVRMGLQPFMNPRRYQPFDYSWSKSLPLRSIIKAHTVEIFFGLGDSVGGNLQYDMVVQELIHFDIEDGLQITNGFRDELYPFYHSDLIYLEQSNVPLDSSAIAFLKHWTLHLMKHYPNALKYFNEHYPKMRAKERGLSLSLEGHRRLIQQDMQAAAQAWQERVEAMQKAVGEFESGRLKTMLDYVLFCFPSKKKCFYASLGLSVLVNRFQNPPAGYPPFVKPDDLTTILGQYVLEGIPFQTYCQIQSPELLRLSYYEFIRACEALPPFERQPADVVRPMYLAELDRTCIEHDLVDWIDTTPTPSRHISEEPAVHG
jgi:hypothetical protein